MVQELFGLARLEIPDVFPGSWLMYKCLGSPLMQKRPQQI